MAYDTETPDSLQVEYVSVDIYDQIYHLRGEDAAHLAHLAAMVDAKMRTVAAGGTVDSLRVAVLASLNLADELSLLRARYAELAGSARQTQTAVRSRSASLADLLDEVFEEVDGTQHAEPMRRAG